mmetsp:Transcript_33945/g.133179  ORF Transcript_33945/g.133179 Transcript_33945/m.133179 type:complete len:820 (-) Transcript_33945:65-2524(-)|eukprot:CAMPEP_0113966120 /NCGR_PEP_ID=MMETSP0011_2-20120614/8148_1 /TAXON_ID=101924 /ORGANISM="Rhodosorus marinus" /LENGTH=819 /DNA_ID=CAMNT_0000978757 /DNA_START=100 /DNA_END=2559 /DNA_ORIENTATION=- /assembly_acc=CAM_ASM_000156
MRFFRRARGEEYTEEDKAVHAHAADLNGSGNLDSGVSDVENGMENAADEMNGDFRRLNLDATVDVEDLKMNHVKVEYDELPQKNIGLEVRGAKDIQRLAEETNCDKPADSVVMLDVEASNPSTILDVAIKGLSEYAAFPPSLAGEARANILIQDVDRSVDQLQGDKYVSATASTAFTWRRYIQGSGFIVTYGRVHGLDRRVSVVLRLAKQENCSKFDPSAPAFVAITIAPTFEQKATKTEYEGARNFAAMLQDEEFYREAYSALNEEELRSAAAHYVGRKVVYEDDLYANGLKGGDVGFEDMMRTGKLFGGLVADIKRKYKWSVYKSDWTDGMTDWRSILKYISTTAWLYFAVIMPIIAFGSLNDENTRQQIGVSESVLSQAICGGLSALFAGQPLAITMTTGPVTVFISVLFSWSEGLGIPFLPFYAWTGIWAAIILTLIVMFDLIAYVRFVGQFTEEIFAMLVALIFISNYIKPLVDAAYEKPTDVFLLSFLLATGMYVMSRWLSLFERRYLLNGITRTLLADFGMPFSVLVWAGIRQIFTNVDVDMLQVPETSGIVTTSGRSWIVPLGDLPVGYIFLAIVPAIFLCMLFYVDQNVAVLLTNKNENKLEKGVGYFLDMQVIAVSMIICSILGIPWANAAVPHSHLHAKILAEKEEYESHGRVEYRIVRAREVRITNFLTHVLIFVSMFLLFIVGYIPSSVVWGFFLYIGVATLDGNQMFERLLLIFTQPTKYPPNHYVRRVPMMRVVLYTLIQYALLILLWFVNENFYLPEGGVFNAGLLFPLVILSFVPIRKLLLPRIFLRKELHALEMEKEDFSD